jgi:hypothetical protein
MWKWNMIAAIDLDEAGMRYPAGECQAELNRIGDVTTAV